MKAMILAAGLGTRLQPLTENKPKALVELNGKPLLEHVVEKLYRAGIRQIIINIHHFPALMTRFIRQLHFDGLEIMISDESGQLLDTGGGILKAKEFLDGEEPFMVHNADVISPVDLTAMTGFHLRHKSLATLAVCDRPSSRLLAFDDDLLLCGWEDNRTNERIIARETASVRKFAFSGIHILEPAFFRLIRQTGKFSVIEAYLELASSQEIRGFEHPQEGFFDLGDPRKLDLAEKYLSNQSR